MFNFNHSEAELRDIIQAIEGKIASLQTHLQKLVVTANTQAQAQNGQPAPAAPAAVADTSVDSGNAAPVSSDPTNAGTAPATT